MPHLVIICGLSFAGKSTMARELGHHLGYAEVDVDRTKVARYGADVQDTSLSRAAWDQIYAETDQQIRDHLIAGRSVIDASRTFTRAEREHLRRLSAATGSGTVVVHVTTPEAIARQRWQTNRTNPTRRDVSDADFEDVVRAMEPPGDDEQPLRFHPHDDVVRWITANRERFR